MRQLAKFEENYAQSLAEIRDFAARTDDFGDLVRLLLETSVDPYDFMPKGWELALHSAQAFSDLCYALHQALHDDGDVTFYTVNGEPKFGFFHAAEATDENGLDFAKKRSKEVYGRNHEIKIIRLEEWIAMLRFLTQVA